MSKKTATYTFDQDALSALYWLLDHVHYDDFAKMQLFLLPEELRNDLLNLTWLEWDTEPDCS